MTDAVLIVLIGAGLAVAGVILLALVAAGLLLGSDGSMDESDRL